MQLLFSATWGTVSGWWTPVCLLLGFLYGWLLFRQPGSLGKIARYGLFAARTITIFLLSFLLMAPLIKSVAYNPQKPLILIAQDNSESIRLCKKTRDENDLSKLKQQLGDQYDVREFD